MVMIWARVFYMHGGECVGFPPSNPHRNHCPASIRSRFKRRRPLSLPYSASILFGETTPRAFVVQEMP